MFNTRMITCALAIAGLLFIGSQAVAQGARPPTDVTVVNTPTLNVGDPAALAAANAQALAPALGVGTPVTFTLDPSTRTYSVPVGQRLVIEYASGQCSPVTFDGVTSYNPPFISATTNGNSQGHSFAVPIANSQPLINGGFVPFGHLVKIYADAGSNVTLVSGTVNNCLLLLSGQLVSG